MSTDAGVQQARRIISQAAGFTFGGELVPFADHFKTLALDSIEALEQQVRDLTCEVESLRDELQQEVAAQWGLGK